jgi:hypothetical protein
MAYAEPLAQADIDVNAMQELVVHNALIGDRAALDAAWEADGYWFFRGVLDREAVAALRGIFVAELEHQGVVDRGVEGDAGRRIAYNGASLAHFPRRMEPLAGRTLWKPFVASPKIHAFFSSLLGAEPFWVPIAEYRATPPTSDRRHSRFDSIHQDGPYSPGILFRICWVPLSEIDAQVGGIALAHGMTEKVNRHPLNWQSNCSIPSQEIPSASWRRATYRPGDLLLINRWTPHSGLANWSDRFRLSLDLRLMSKTDKCPLIGHLQDIGGTFVTVRSDIGDTKLRIEPDTYVRDDRGQRLIGRAIKEFFAIGCPIIVGYEGDKATVVRLPH